MRVPDPSPAQRRAARRRARRRNRLTGDEWFKLGCLGFSAIWLIGAALLAVGAVVVCIWAIIRFTLTNT